VTDVFATPDATPELRASDLQTSYFDRLGAQAAETFYDNPTTRLLRQTTRDMAANGNMQPVGAAGELDLFGGAPAAADSFELHHAAIDAARAAVPDVAIDDARRRVKEKGLEAELKLPEQPSIKQPVLDGLIADAEARRQRQLAIARGPQGFVPAALGLVTSLGVGMIDPLSIAAFSVPVLGEARAARMLAAAGDSVLGRTGVRALQGAAQGAAGTAALQPADWWLHTRDGQDYTFTDALKSVAMGAGMGATFHAGGGGIGDLWARLRGRPLKGSPEDLLARGLLTGTHVRGAELEAAPGTPGEPPPALDEVPGLANPDQAIPPHPAEVLADLPAAARQDAMQAAAADIIADRPVAAGEMLDIAADHEPRIAESMGEPGRHPDVTPGAPEGPPGSNAESDRRVSEDLDRLAPLREGDTGTDTGAADSLRLVEAPEGGVIEPGPGEKYFKAVDADGNVKAEILVRVEGDTARIVNIIGEKPRQANTLGPAQLRGLLDQFRAQHPEVGTITGERVSGAREGGGYSIRGGTEVSVPLPDRNARLSAAVADPRWRELADRPEPYDEPAAIAESRAAEATPEPASVERSVTAVEKAAADVEQAWREAEANYTEEERAVVNDALEKLEQDRAAREQIIRDGAACLAAAGLGE
jgi:hypothetical protein